MQAMQRAKKSGVLVDLKVTDIDIPKTCPLLGIPIFHTKHRYGMNNPSLDQIIPGKGYTKENTWVISWRANVIKHDATLNELEKITNNLRAKMTSLFL